MSRALRSPALRPLLLSLSLLTAAIAVLLVAGPMRASSGLQAHTASSAGTTGTTVAVAGKQFSFSAVVAGKPVRWNPCAAIHWRANVSRGPVGGLTVLRAAVAKIAATTGTTWVYDGATTTVPTSRTLPTTYRPGNGPVLIGWADAASSDLLRHQPAGVAGMTRTTWFSMPYQGGTAAQTKAAVVALDRTDKLPLRGASSWSTIALHELSHVMGLGHATDSRQLLAPVLPASAAGLQYGDTAGLIRLGRTQGCVTFPTD